MREVAFLRVSCKVLEEFKSLFERVKVVGEKQVEIMN